MKYSKYFKDYNNSIYDLLNNFDTLLIDKSVINFRLQKK